MISVQIEYNGKREEVLLKNPTRKDRQEYLLKIKTIRKVKEEDEQTDALIEFIGYREELMRKMIMKAPFPATEEGLNELPVVELDKLVRAIESEVNLSAGFQTPSNGQPPTAPEES